jgi:hypothetical protein
MAGLIYSGTFSGTSFAGVSVSAAQDLFYLLAASSTPLRLRRLSISASGITSPTNLVLSIQRYPATVTAGSGGTSITPVEVAQVSARAAAATMRANDTTRASTTGTKAVLWTGTMQDINNLDELRIPELYELIPGGNALIVGVEVAPSAVTLYGTLMFSELD